MDELLAQLKAKTGLPLDQIKPVVDGVFDFLSDKLPGNLGDQVKSFVEGGGDAVTGGVTGMMDQAKGMLGGLMGGGEK